MDDDLDIRRALEILLRSHVTYKFDGDVEIFNLNTDVLSDPDRIKVGQQIKLPHKA